MILFSFKNVSIAQTVPTERTGNLQTINYYLQDVPKELENPISEKLKKEELHFN